MSMFTELNGREKLMIEFLVSRKEKELLNFIRQQKPGTISVDIYKRQPVSFSRDLHTDGLIRARTFDKELTRYRYKLYLGFYGTKNNFLNLCKYRYDLHTRTFREMTIRYKLNCPYYLYCQIKELNYPIISKFEEKITRKWRRYYHSNMSLSPEFTTLPSITDVFGDDACANCHPKCEICGEELSIRKIRVHHLAYIIEAVPTDDNLNWLQYYQLHCSKCHSKQRGKVNGQKNWLGIVSKELTRRRTLKEEKRWEENQKRWEENHR